MAETVPAVIAVAESAGVWMFDVAVIVAAIKFVTESDRVWIDVAVTVPVVMFVADNAAV